VFCSAPSGVLACGKDDERHSADDEVKDDSEEACGGRGQFMWLILRPRWFDRLASSPNLEPATMAGFSSQRRPILASTL
jgi:hypothetical protein